MLLGLSDEWLTCNEGDHTWNVREVVAHLIVCERTNWLPRAKIILSDSADKTLGAIDMTAHFDMAKSTNLQVLLREFSMLREGSIMELDSFHLQHADLTRSAFHPKIKAVNLQQLIAAWVTHDLSHLTQISRIMARRYKDEVGPFHEFLKILK